MFCGHCGKENKGNNQFCEHCGKPLTQPTTAQPNMPPQQAYPWKQTNIDPELKRKWEEQKAHDRKKRLEKRMKMTSVLWLIAGALQALVGLIFVIVGVIQSIDLSFGDSAYDIIEKWIYIGRAFFGGAMLFMGSVGIRTFFKNKKENGQYVNKLFVPIALLIMQFVIVLLTYLFSDYLNRWGREIDMVLAALLLTPTILVPSVLDIANITAIRKQKSIPQKMLVETSRKGTVLFFGTLVLVACFTISSLAFSYIHNQKWTEYEIERDRVISLVRNGSLNGYPDMPIKETLETGIAKIDKSTYKPYAYIYDSHWRYDPYRPQYIYFDEHKTGKELAPDDVLISTWFSYEPIEDEYTQIDLTFKFNEKNNEITVYAISENDKILNEIQRGLWVNKFFGDNKTKPVYDLNALTAMFDNNFTLDDFDELDIEDEFDYDWYNGQKRYYYSFDDPNIGYLMFDQSKNLTDICLYMNIKSSVPVNLLDELKQSEYGYTTVIMNGYYFNVNTESIYISKDKVIAAKMISIGYKDKNGNVLSEEDSRALAEEVYRRASNGEDFDMLIQEYSSGPGSGTFVFTYWLMPEELWNAASALEIGQISNIIGIEDGSHYGHYYIIKRVENSIFETNATYENK